MNLKCGACVLLVLVAVAARPAFGLEDKKNATEAVRSDEKESAVNKRHAGIPQGGHGQIHGEVQTAPVQNPFNLPDRHPVGGHGFGGQAHHDIPLQGGFQDQHLGGGLGQASIGNSFGQGSFGSGLGQAASFGQQSLGGSFGQSSIGSGLGQAASFGQQSLGGSFDQSSIGSGLGQAASFGQQSLGGSFDQSSIGSGLGQAASFGEQSLGGSFGQSSIGSGFGQGQIGSGAFQDQQFASGFGQGQLAGGFSQSNQFEGFNRGGAFQDQQFTSGFDQGQLGGGFSQFQAQAPIVGQGGFTESNFGGQSFQNVVPSQQIPQQLTSQAGFGQSTVTQTGVQKLNVPIEITIPVSIKQVQDNGHLSQKTLTQVVKQVERLAPQPAPLPVQPQIIHRPQPQVIQRPQPQVILRPQPQVILRPQPQVIQRPQPQVIHRPQPQVIQRPQPQIIQRPQPQPQQFVKVVNKHQEHAIDPRISVVQTVTPAPKPFVPVTQPNQDYQVVKIVRIPAPAPKPVVQPVIHQRVVPVQPVIQQRVIPVQPRPQPIPPPQPRPIEKIEPPRANVGVALTRDEFSRLEPFGPGSVSVYRLGDVRVNQQNQFIQGQPIGFGGGQQLAQQSGFNQGQQSTSRFGGGQVQQIQQHTVQGAVQPQQHVQTTTTFHQQPIVNQGQQVQTQFTGIRIPAQVPVRPQQHVQTTKTTTTTTFNHQQPQRVQQIVNQGQKQVQQQGLGNRIEVDSNGNTIYRNTIQIPFYVTTPAPQISVDARLIQGFNNVGVGGGHQEQLPLQSTQNFRISSKVDSAEYDDMEEHFEIEPSSRNSKNIKEILDKVAPK